MISLLKLKILCEKNDTKILTLEKINVLYGRRFKNGKISIQKNSK